MATKNEILSDDERIDARLNDKKTSEANEPEFVPVKIGVFEEDIRARIERDFERAIEEQERRYQEERDREQEAENIRQMEEDIARMSAEFEAMLNRKEIERRAGKKISDIPLEELSQYLPPEYKPATTLEEMADRSYDDFRKSEGCYKQMYICPTGNPTIGIGHLVVAKGDIGDANKVKWWRDKYKKLGLVDEKGKPLTEAQKVQEFNALVSAMKRGAVVKKGNIIISPKLSTLPQEEIDKVYRDDFKIHYDKIVAKGFPIYKYPLPIQTSMVHLSFWRGNPSKLVSNIKDMNNLESVANGTKLALSGSNAAMRKTAQCGVDSLGIALNNYHQNIIIPDGVISTPNEVDPRPRTFAASREKGR